jgi:glycosyltransferase involved in cell wall biosynthesis
VSQLVSIVIPCFDEEKRLPDTLEDMARFLAARGLSAELVIVDDGSRDRTAEVAEATARRLGLALRVLRHAPNRGKGFAMRRGVLAAQGDVCLLTDADRSVPIEHLERFLERLGPGVDAVIGSRRMPGARIALHQPRLREALGGAFRSLSQRILGLERSDFTCGFKLWRAGAAQEVFRRQRIWGWGYDTEILLIAKRLGQRLVEEPVEWRDDARTRVRLGRDVVRSALDLARIRWNDWRGRYRP